MTETLTETQAEAKLAAAYRPLEAEQAVKLARLLVRVATPEQLAQALAEQLTVAQLKAMILDLD